MMVHGVEIEDGVPCPQKGKWYQIAEAMKIGNSVLIPFHREDDLCSCLRILCYGYTSEQDEDGNVRVWRTS